MGGRLGQIVRGRKMPPLDALAAKRRDPGNPLGMLAAEHHGGSEG